MPGVTLRTLRHGLRAVARYAACVVDALIQECTLAHVIGSYKIVDLSFFLSF